MITPNPNKPVILVVDDAPQNLALMDDRKGAINPS